MLCDHMSEEHHVVFCYYDYSVFSGILLQHLLFFFIEFEGGFRSSGGQHDCKNDKKNI